MKNVLLGMALLAVLLATPALGATCQSVASFTPSCVGGSIVQDTMSGTCRTIKCASGSASMQASACDKPDNANPPQYFELYKQAVAGTQVTKVCLGTTCVGSYGFAKSPTYTCGTPPPTCTPSTEVCDGKDNNCNGQVDENNVCAPTCTPTTEVCDGKDNNCNGQVDENNVCAPACTNDVFKAAVTCTSTITKDVSTGCRAVSCGTGSNTITTSACNKGGYFEVYRQGATGTPPKVCFGTACIQYEGYVKSASCTTTPPPTNTTPPPPTSSFPLKTNIVSTIFWVGQGPSADTGWTNNYDSAWDVWWQEHYGGYDDPNSRNGWYPAGFTPKENPFYVAIPYTDYSYVGRKWNAFDVVPWANEKASWGSQESMIKNRWVKVIKGGKTAYAQVENAGPGPTDDWQYVFGSNPQPTTDFGWKAGIDVSPAVRDYLSLGPVDTVSWQWVKASDVPAGPWKTIVTTRQSCWASTICP